MRRERILTRDLWVLLAGLVFLFLGTTLLVPVLPAVMARGAGSSGAGLVTAAFYLPAVATQLRMPEVMRRVPARTLIVGSFALLGLPCLAYPVVMRSVASIVALTAVRGVGFGIATVASGTLIAQLAPPGRRGSVIGYAGLASGIPPVFAPALGVTLLHDGGATSAFVLAGALGLGGALCSVWLGRRAPAGRARSRGLLHAARDQALAWPFTWFSLVSLTRGAAISFASLWLLRGGLASAATFLLAFGTLAYLTRWLGGRVVDRSGARILVMPGALAALAGLVLLALGDAPGAVVVGAGVLFGGGYGLLQSAAQLDMLARGSSDGFAVATTAYNIAIDAGVGVGGALLGLVAAAAGYGTAFWVLPGVMVLALATMLVEPRPHPAAGATSGR